MTVKKAKLNDGVKMGRPATQTTSTTEPQTLTTTEMPTEAYTTEPPTIVPTTPEPTTPFEGTTPFSDGPDQPAPTTVAADEDDDADMPTQETKTYKTYLVLKPLFTKLLEAMPFTTEFGYRGYPGIRIYTVKDLINIVTQADKIEVNDMNAIIGIIASGPFAVVSKFMEYIQDTSKQQELWMIVQDV